MLQTLSYIINVAPEGVPQVVKLSQNENGRTLAFALTGVGTVNIPAGATVTISGTKPDGVVYSATGTLSGNVASFSETTQMTAVLGIWPAKIKVTYNGETIATCKIVMAIDPDPVAPGSVPSSSQLNGLVAEAQQYATYAKEEAYGSPLVAATAAAMTDKTRVYVYTGSETGKTAGHWYFWNGSAWTDGGVYNSQGINTDTTLTLAGMAADAKATGDQITTIKTDFGEFCDSLNISISVGKNLFNMDTVDMDYALKSSNGTLVYESGKVTSDYIPVEGATDYYFGRNGVEAVSNLACFYDANKAYISYAQYYGSTGHTTETPSNARFLKITFAYATIPVSKAQLNKSSIQPYDKYGTEYTAPFETESEVLKILTDLNVGKVMHYNLFDKSTALIDVALNMLNGTTQTESGKYTSDFIPVTPGEKYCFGKNGASASGNLYVLYDLNKNYINGYQYFTNPTIPATVSDKIPAYLRFTAAYGTIPLAQAQVNEGSVKPYDSYGYTYKEDSKRRVTIATSGGDYTSIRSAFETEGNDVHYIIYTGTYDVAQDFTAEEINNANYDSSHADWCGIVVPSNSIVEGVGKVIIDCNLSSDYNYNKRMQIATLNVIGSCELRNLIVKASGNRVPIHDDFVGAERTTHKMIDCSFIQTRIDASSAHGYAIGLRNGQTIDFENCRFVPGIGVHDSNGLSTPSVMSVKNSNAENWMRFGGYANGVAHKITLDNCDYQWFKCDQNNLIVRNYSNNRGRQELQNINYDTFDSFAIKKIAVSSGVTANDIVTVYGSKATEWNGLVYGVAIENRDSYGYARVMVFNGCIYTPLVGIASCSNGDKVTLQNSRLVVNANGTVGEIRHVDSGDGFIYFY